MSDWFIRELLCSWLRRFLNEAAKMWLDQNHSRWSVHERGQLESPFPSWNNCYSAFKQGTKPLITPVRQKMGYPEMYAAPLWNKLNNRPVCDFILLTYVTGDHSMIKMHHIVQFQAACLAFLTFFPFIFRYLTHTFKDMNLDLLLYDCLSAVFHLPNLGITFCIFSGMAITLNLFEGDDVYRCEYGEKKLSLDLLLSANTHTPSPLSRNVLAFLQHTPIPILLVGSEKSKRCTSEEYQRGDT